MNHVREWGGEEYVRSEGRRASQRQRAGLSCACVLLPFIPRKEGRGKRDEKHWGRGDGRIRRFGRGERSQGRGRYGAERRLVFGRREG